MSQGITIKGKTPYDKSLPVLVDDQGRLVITVDGSTVLTIVPPKPTDAYELSNFDDATSTEYYGYEAADGSWYVKKIASTGAITFIKGASDYATGWTDRATHTYASYGATF